MLTKTSITFTMAALWYVINGILLLQYMLIYLYMNISQCMNKNDSLVEFRVVLCEHF